MSSILSQILTLFLSNVLPYGKYNIRSEVKVCALYSVPDIEIVLDRYITIIFMIVIV